MGNGFKEGDLVEFVVKLDEGEILWRVNGEEKANYVGD